MRILSAQQMQDWEKACIQKIPVSPQKLMERAARACLEEILLILKQKSLIPSSPKTAFPILVLCGPGNNGGDGFAISHFLRSLNFAVDVYFFGDFKKISSEAQHFYQKLDPAPQPISAKKDPNFEKKLRQSKVVIDALFGIGLNRPLQNSVEKILEKVNRHRALKIAIDVPTGISGTFGKISKQAFKADFTITFECPKWGQLDLSAWDLVGELNIKKIGLRKSYFPQEVDPQYPLAEWNDAAAISPFFSPRPKRMHKGAAGKVLVVAGSASMPGAGYLSAMAALRSGAGKVVWALPREAFRKIDLRYPEVILQDLPSEQGEFSAAAAEELIPLSTQFSSLVLGPGLGSKKGSEAFLEKILPQISLPMILDADALNLLAKNPAWLEWLKNSILTPHPQEMARLVGLSTQEVLQNRYLIAQQFALKHRLWLVLKGYRSVIASPKGKLYVNASGGPNLAVPGSGDVLSGVIGALLAVHSPEIACRAGVYLHGRAGDELQKKYGDRGILASEIAAGIPQVVRDLIASD